MEALEHGKVGEHGGEGRGPEAREVVPCVLLYDSIHQSQTPLTSEVECVELRAEAQCGSHVLHPLIADLII